MGTVTDTAMPDLLNLFRCDVEQLSRAFSVSGIGSLIGGVSAGIVVDRFQSYADLQLAVLLLCVAISLVAEVLACSLFFFGIFEMATALSWSAINVSKYYIFFLRHIHESIRQITNNYMFTAHFLLKAC